MSETKLLKSSGYPAYDRKIELKMKQWKFKPFLVGGAAVPVCTSATFIYNQSR